MIRENSCREMPGGQRDYGEKLRGEPPGKKESKYSLVRGALRTGSTPQGGQTMFPGEG